MLQIKGQDKSLKSPINEEERDNLSEKEFRVMTPKNLSFSTENQLLKGN